MRAKLRQVADGFAYRVRSFSSYGVNGYRFRTTSYEQSRPNRRTTSSGVFTPALMRSSIMEELKKYTNSSFMVLNLLIPSYSNTIGLILK